jgi:hypothetical protein
MENRKKLLIILSVFLLIFTCVSPAFAISACKEGKTNCTHPCGDYVDSNGNKICDRSETTQQNNSVSIKPLIIAGITGVIVLGSFALWGTRKK